MDAALGWIGSIVEWFGRWIPHLLIVRTTQGGIKFVRGKNVKEMGPGMHVYWPITTDVEIIHTARDTLNLKSQRLQTRDDKTISVSVAVIYRIDNVIKAVTKTTDYENTISDTAQAAVVQVLSQMTYKKLTHEVHNKVPKRLAKKIRAYLRPFGVAVEKAYLTDYAQTLVFTSITGD